MLNNDPVTAKFIKEISEELKLDESKVSEVLNHFFNIIINFASQKKAIFFWLTGFGKIYYRRYKKPDVRRKPK